MSVESKTVTPDEHARYVMEAKKLRCEQLAILSGQLFRLPQAGLRRLAVATGSYKKHKATTRT